MTQNLKPEKALIFRITHVENVPWILENGLHCRSSGNHDPNFVDIGNPDLIDKRASRPVLIAPGGVLSDYVPFYFTPYSIMLYNIHTGYGGVTRRPNSEIVIFVTSLPKLASEGQPFIFTSGHAYPIYAKYYNSMAQISQIDWPLLASRNFQNDPEDPGKKERYQAEALVHLHLPIESLLGLVCSSPKLKESLEKQVNQRQLSLKVLAKPTWFF